MLKMRTDRLIVGIILIALIFSMGCGKGKEQKGSGAKQPPVDDSAPDTPEPTEKPVDDTPDKPEPTDEPDTPTEPMGCQEDARVCPDGSTVVREGPDCEFAACPEEETLKPTEEPKPEVTEEPTIVEEVLPTLVPTPEPTVEEDSELSDDMGSELNEVDESENDVTSEELEETITDSESALSDW